MSPRKPVSATSRPRLRLCSCHVVENKLLNISLKASIPNHDPKVDDRMTTFNYLFGFMCIFAVGHFVWILLQNNFDDSCSDIFNLLHIFLLSTNLEEHHRGFHGGEFLIWRTFNVLILQDLGLLPPNPARQKILS